MSTKEVLSESELDALMDSVSSGAVPLEEGFPAQNCQSFDFSTREQVLLAQMPALETLNEKHSLAFTQAIRESFKLPAEVEMGEVQLIKLEEAIHGIHDPAGINILKIAPLSGVSYVVLPGGLLSFFVDRYFGGAVDESEFKPLQREKLTPTENRINEVLLEKFLSTMKEAWSGKMELSTEIISFETKPEFLQWGSPDELAMLFPMVVQVGEWKSSIDWIVPYAAFEPLRQKLGISGGNPTAKQGNDWEGYFRKELLSIDLEIRGVFTTRNVSISEVLSLKQGSIVPLKMPSEVSVWIEGQLISTGEHGVLNGNKSIKIIDMLNK